MRRRSLALFGGFLLILEVWQPSTKLKGVNTGSLSMGTCGSTALARDMWCLYGDGNSEAHHYESDLVVVVITVVLAGRQANSRADQQKQLMVIRACPMICIGEPKM